MLRNYSRISKRFFSAKTTTVANGIKVSTLDTLMPVSSISVIIHSGSRQDTPTKSCAHLLKTSILKTHGLETIRSFELRGNTLSSSLGREHISLNSEFLRDDLVDVVPQLLNHVFNPAPIQAFEFLRACPLVSAETSSSLSDPNTLVFENLYQLAFRSGLGNSLFSSDNALQSCKTSDITEFSSKNISLDNVSVVGTGVNHEELESLVESFASNLAESNTYSTQKISKNTSPSTFHSGETRIDAGPDSIAHFAIAYPGVSIGSKDFEASLVLKSLLDGTQRTKYGNHCGMLASTDSEISCHAFTKSHSDAGIFGIMVRGDNEKVKTAASKAISSLQNIASGSINESALNNAKKAAILEYEESLASPDSLALEIAQQLFYSKNFKTSMQIKEAIEKVSTKDIQKISKDMLKSRPAVVAYGNIRVLPWANEL